MDSNTDKIISRLTVRLRDLSDNYIGSGIIFNQDSNKDKVYILTAAHCLYFDSDNFADQRLEVKVDFFNPVSLDYESLTSSVNPTLLFSEEKKDVAVLLFEKKDVESITGTLPQVYSVKERSSYIDFITKGFPKATFSKEIAVLKPTYLQDIDIRFQLQLNEDYLAKFTSGFSGSGIFLVAGNEIYLFGIFTRFRPNEKGKVIYCQYIETVNELLDENFLPRISFSYFGNHGLTRPFFKKHIEKSITGLGPRFSEVLNFKLPIAKPFNDIAKDSTFFSRLINIVDNWIIDSGYKILHDNSHINSIEKEYNDLRIEATRWLENLDKSVTAKLDLDWLTSSLHSLKVSISKKSNSLYELQREQEKLDKGTKKDYSYNAPYSEEISRLREISQNNGSFLDDIEKNLNLSLADHPFLIVKGDAGNGKSHLLGDIAKTRTKNNLPTLLLLGQNFVPSKNIWENIKSELNINCSDEELLLELNNIGRQIGSRVMILIDALNEGAGAELWKSRIAGFINDFSGYPYIGLVMTIRTTYIDYVIPKEILESSIITIIDHEGFKGSEYAALKLFCEFHNLKQPHFPILAPEYAKPLFLKLICEAVKETPEKKFPLGFQGISKIFKIYTESLNHKLESKRENYKNRKIAGRAIQFLSQQCFEKNERSLALDTAIELFDKKFPDFKNLINDLIEENIFIRKIDYDLKSKKEIEVIYFSYERLGDFFMSEELLNSYENREDVIIAFKKNNELGRLIRDEYWSYNGLLEAFSVLLPERYELEIYEVYSWVFEQEKLNEHYFRQDSDRINRFLFESLNWRTIESIDDEKITSWFQGDFFRIDYDELFLKLVELSPVVGHPFNSDRLFKILKRYKMPERDGFWQKHTLYFNNNDDNHIAFPLRRLIDWAWTAEISNQLDIETARLTAQTLSWLLASTSQRLRDQTTKALVNLLEQQPEALLEVLKSFRNIDDFYILERLYAVAYGCVLRADNEQAVIQIAKTVYSFVFKDCRPQNHILLRDYARNIVEYAIHKNPSLKFEISLLRPPYKSSMPDYLPTEADVLKFNYPHDQPEYKIDYNYMNNRIYHSVTGFGDFAKHIDATLDDFAPISFVFEEEYKLFFSSLEKKQRAAINGIIKILKQKSQVSYDKHGYSSRSNEDLRKDLLKMIDDLLAREIASSVGLFESEQLTFFTGKVLSFLKRKYDKNLKTLPKSEINSVKYWIINRAFELGYNTKLHGSYDHRIGNRNSDYKIDRIGKKYQVIAFMEIMAALVDNYKINKFSWSSNKKYEFYNGPWQFYLRNIDPAFISRDIEENEVEFDVNIPIEKKWHDEPTYTNWSQDDAKWIEILIDLPAVKEVIQKRDESSEEWLSLIKTAKWREPKPVGKGKYEGRKKDIFYKIQAYFVKRNDKEKIISYLSRKNFWGNWMPETSSPINLINREKFWSPAYFDIDKEKKWQTIPDTNLKVIIATTDAVGEMSEDKSGAHSYYDMPCKTLFDGMKLNYAPVDGEFRDSKGLIILKNIDYKGLMIKKMDLIKYLDDNKLEIIWTILGEKMSYYNNRENNYFKELSGVYYLKDNEINGQMISFDRE